MAVCLKVLVVVYSCVVGGSGEIGLQLCCEAGDTVFFLLLLFLRIPGRTGYVCLLVRTAEFEGEICERPAPARASQESNKPVGPRKGHRYCPAPGTENEGLNLLIQTIRPDSRRRHLLEKTAHACTVLGRSPVL